MYYGQPFTSSIESAIKLTRCLKQYEDDPNARWEKNVKLENTNINWKQVVNSDCLIQKITDVSEVNFRNDLKSFVVRYV